MEVRLEGKTPLLPGQLLRFDAESPVYGEVIGVRTLDPEKQEGSLAKIRILYGSPSLSLTSAAILSDEEMTAEVQRLQEPFEYPLRFGGFTAEFDRLGVLTLIEGDEFAAKYEVLNALMRAIEPYQRLLVIDPLGVYSSDGWTCRRAGEDFRLSLQSVGSKRFLSAMAETFPDSLRDQALQVIAGYLPITPEFVPYADVLRAAGYDHSPLRNLLLQSLQSAEHSRVFADDPDHALDFGRMVSDRISVIDLSPMDEPWKTLFYEEICLEIFHNAGGDVVPVLVYPENYLGDFETWIHKADEAELNLLVLTSPYPPEDLDRMANNLLVADSLADVRMEGDLTLGLPVTFSLPEPEPAAAPAESPAMEPVDISGPVLVPDALSESAEAPLEEMTPSLAGEAFPEAMIPPVEELPPEAPVLSGPPEPPALAPDFPIPGPPPGEDEVPALPLPESVEVPGPSAAESVPPPEPPSPPETPPAPVQAGPEPLPSREEPAFDSILGPLDAMKSAEDEPVDFDFDLNLDLKEPPLPEPQPAPPSALPESMQGFAEDPPPVSESPGLDFGTPEGQPSVDASAPSAYEDAWESMPSISDIEAGLTLPYGEPEPLAPPSPPPPPAPSVPDAQPLNTIFEEPLPEALAAPVSPAPEPSPADYGPPPVEIQAGIVDITPPQPEPALPPAVEASFPGGHAEAPSEAPMRPPLEQTVTEPDLYETMPVYSKPEGDAGYRGFNVGDRVRHPSYGSGTISKVIPMENNVILNIAFDTVGKRLLDPALCQLEKE